MPLKKFELTGKVIALFLENDVYVVEENTGHRRVFDDLNEADDYFDSAVRIILDRKE